MAKPVSRTVIYLVGVALLVLGIWLAYAWQFKHFYEVLLLGLYVVLWPLAGHNYTGAQMKRLYGMFLIAGIVGDLLLGQLCFNLWKYNYSSLWEYVLLYAWIYPVAGIVMVQSYDALRNALGGKSAVSSKGRRFWHTVIFAATLFAIISSAAWICMPAEPLRALGTTVFTFVCMLVYVAVSYKTYRSNRVTLVDDLFANPKVVGLSLLIGVYVNAFLHELPNVPAQQWVYFYDGARVGGVPVVFLIGWPLLLIIPLLVWYDRIPRAKVEL